MGPIASGVYGVGASMRVDLEYTDLEYIANTVVLTAEHPLQHLDIPEIFETPLYGMLPSLFSREATLETALSVR